MTITALIVEQASTLVAASVVPPVAPNMDALPGGKAVQTIINGGAGLAIAACTLAFIYGAGQAALGSNQGNSYMTADGRKKMMYAPLFAALIIATPTIIKWAVDLGKTF